MSINRDEKPMIDSLINKNKVFVEQYKNSHLMRLICSEKMAEKSVRDYLLDCIQVFSDYFQRVVMLRSVFCEEQKFVKVANTHFQEEFRHNLSLLEDRNNRPSIWDPILESTSAWFAWKMFVLSNEEKVVLIHLVLEASAHVFFSAAHKVMLQYQETNYFKIHADVDEEHEKMGVNLLEDISLDKLEGLLLIQKQAWDVLNTTCDRIAELVINKFQGKEA